MNKIYTQNTSFKIQEHPSGMILAFSLMILLMVSLMGMAIISATRTELSISSNTTSGRDTFIRTDAAARMSAFFGHFVMSPDFIGQNADALVNDSDSAIEVAFTPNILSREQLSVDFHNKPAGMGDDYVERYIRAGSTFDREGGGADTDPHIIYRQKGERRGEDSRVFASSVIAIDRINADLLDDKAPKITIAVVSTIGQNLRGSDDTASLQGEPEDGQDVGPYSVISIMFQMVD